MAAITAGMVKELREMTGAGMMDCKKALNETNGNMEEAVEFRERTDRQRLRRRQAESQQRVSAASLPRAILLQQL